jgi:hypothetical protein
MTRPLFRTFVALVITVLVVHLIVRNRTWFEGDTNAHAQVEAVVLGFFSGLLIVSLVSLIKMIVGRFVATTRVEILIARLPSFIGESDEGDPLWDPFLSQVQRLEDHRRTYHLLDVLPEIEMYEETA